MLLALMLVVVAAAPESSQAPSKSRAVTWVVDALKPVSAELMAQYRDLHATPELSFHEEKTAEKLAKKLEALGFKVTRKVGGFGVVGVLENGPGRVLLLRTDMDALPVAETSGLPYASKVTTQDESGKTVSVMHACGHDVHMTAWTGALTVLSKNRHAWKGTIVAIGQPAEERGRGAIGMIDAGLFTTFPKPDVALALHVSNDVAAGKVAFVTGPAFASVDSVDITFFGKGGHGAAPHTTIDPIVMAAHFITNVQTVVSRELNPREPAVITVGSIHGGTKHNIIPAEVKLQLTVRSYSDVVRKRLLDGIARIAKAEAEASNAPQAPKIEVSESIGTLVNDDALATKVSSALRTTLGDASIGEHHPIMGAEDFGMYGRIGGMPILMMWLGAAKPQELEAALAKNEALPTTHSPLFIPDIERTLPTGTAALTIGALTLLAAP